MFGTGSATLETNDLPNLQTSVTFQFTPPPSYRGDVFFNGYDYGPGPIALTFPGPGTYDFIVYGAVPQAPTWAMMLLGFAGLGFAGWRRALAGG